MNDDHHDVAPFLDVPFYKKGGFYLSLLLSVPPFLLAFNATFHAGGRSAGLTWGPEEERGFMQGCTSKGGSGSEAICRCILDDVKPRHSPAELSRLVKGSVDGREIFQGAVQRCAATSSTR